MLGTRLITEGSKVLAARSGGQRIEGFEDSIIRSRPGDLSDLSREYRGRRSDRVDEVERLSDARLKAGRQQEPHLLRYLLQIQLP